MDESSASSVGTADGGKSRQITGDILPARAGPLSNPGSPERLDHLRQVKLRTLVGDRWGRRRAETSMARAIPGGAVLVEGSASHAWVLIDDGEPTRLGPGLLVSASRGVRSLDVLVDGSPSAAGIVARRAAYLSGVQVWQVHGRLVEPASPAAVLPDHDAPRHETVALLEAHGLEAVFEHGVLRGEILGLEVARTVGDRLEVGVGRYDRSARIEMRPGEDVDSALEEAAAAVRGLRRPDAPPHPANTLARSRWLRSLVCSNPEMIGLASVSSVAPPLPWFDLTEVASSPAVGTTKSGERVVAVFSVGVDPDLVPTAADCYAHYSTPGDALWLVLPEGDDLPVVRTASDALCVESDIRLVPRRWEDFGTYGA